MGCFNWLILAGVFVFMMASLLRWFEQTVDAVDARDWNKLTVLVVFPFAVWWYPSRVGASRPMPVPVHEPVRGFGKLPKGGIAEPLVDEGAAKAQATLSTVPQSPAGSTPPADGPPPGTPEEFLRMPVVPPVKKRTKPAVDPEQIAKLRQKMIEQGMLKPPDEDKT